MVNVVVESSGVTKPTITVEDNKPNVFISYSRKDLFFVDRLRAALVGCGVNATVDRDAIENGEKWWARIQQLILEADTIVFVLTSASISSEVCKREIDFAQSLNKRLVPIVAGDLKGCDVPEALSQFNYILFITDSPSAGAIDIFDEAVNQLIRAIEIDIFWIREHTRLGILADRWNRLGRSSDINLRGGELSASEIWLTTQPKYAPAPTEAHKSLIRMSLLATTRRRQIIIGLSLLAFTLASTVLALTYGGFLDPEFIEGQYNGMRNRFSEENLSPGNTVRECNFVCPEMVLIAPGSFMMGSPSDEQERQDNEGPQHRVMVLESFLLSKYEVTFAEWDACNKAGGCSFHPPDKGWDENAEYWGRGNRPVINVSFNDVQQYIQWLSKKTGVTYRLPSEAEWEYSARAGKTSRFFFGEDEMNLGDYAWYAANSDKRTQPVGGKKPNAFGLYDMHGNVSEWVADSWHPNYDGAPTDGSAWITGGESNYRVLRGGSWSGYPRFQRSAARDRAEVGTDLRGTNMGFRVARTLSILTQRPEQSVDTMNVYYNPQ